MFHIDTCKDVKWIEIFLRERCQTNLNEYLTKYYDIPSKYVEVKEKVLCDICDQHISWLQGHLSKKHDVKLDDYIGRFNIKSEFHSLITDKKLLVEKKQIELDRVKTQARKDFVLTQDETLVCKYQMTSDPLIFKQLLNDWKSKIYSHAVRNANCLQGFSQEECVNDLYQELLESFLVAVRKYDVDRKIKFKTYVWSCLQSKTQVIRSSFLTKKRNATEQSIHELTYSSNSDLSEDIESRIYSNSSWGEYSTPDCSYEVEFNDLIDSVNLNNTQKLIIDGILLGFTREEVCVKADISQSQYSRLLKSLRIKFNSVKFNKIKQEKVLDVVR